MSADPIAADTPELRAALEASDRPADDLTDQGRSFFRRCEDGRTVGFGGENALLRSIVILPEARGREHGKAATGLLAQRAADAVECRTAPAAGLNTRQAAALCPSTAALHWGIEDPAAAEGSDLDKERAFSQAARIIKSHRRVFEPAPRLDRQDVPQEPPAGHRRDGRASSSRPQVA